MIFEYYRAKGKKKTCVSTVLIKSGVGRIIINRFIAFNFFKRKNLLNYIIKPFCVINSFNFDVFVKTKGGGEVSKAVSIMYAISKALLLFDKKAFKILKKEKLLKSDNRIVERKKVGYVKSRKKKQYTKR
ncbi:uS9 family ribosomal protein [Candidatus Vidania fulgoroideorum]